MFCKEPEKVEFLEALRELEAQESNVQVTQLASRLSWDQDDFDRVSKYLEFEEEITIKYRKIKSNVGQRDLSSSIVLTLFIALIIFCCLPIIVLKTPGLWNLLSTYPFILSFASGIVIAMCAEERYLTVLLKSSLRWSYIKDRVGEQKQGKAEDETISGNLVSGILCEMIFGGRPVLFEMGIFRFSKIPIKMVIKLKVYLSLIPITILFVLAYAAIGPSLDLDVRNAQLLFKYFIIVAGAFYILSLRSYRKRKEITAKLLMYKPKDARISYQWLYAEWGERNLMSRRDLEKVSGESDSLLDPQKPLYVKIKARQNQQKKTFSQSLKYKYYQP